MKWIGQHIVDLIARFRSDVYMESLANPGADTDKFLVADSDGKVGYRSGTEVISDSGAITSVTIESDSGSGSRSAQMSGDAVFKLLGARGVGVTNAGDTFTAETVDSEIDHDALTNFVTAEHVDWAGDNSGTATIHANNIDDLHGAGVSGSANQLLTDDGDGTVTSESTLTYDSETLNIGVDDDGAATISRLRHTDEAGGDLYLRGGDATGTDKAGGDLQLFGGRSTSNAAGGAVIIKTNPASGSSGASLQSSSTVASFRSDGNVLFNGSLIFEGATPDAHEIFLTPADPGADATITMPAVTGTMAVSGASGTNIVVIGSGTGYVGSVAGNKSYFGNSLYGFAHFNWAAVNATMVADDATFTLSEDYNGVGQIIPAALSKVVAKVSCRPAATSDETLKVTICSTDRHNAEGTDGVTGANSTWTALASATHETEIGVFKDCDATFTGSVAASKVLSIGVGIAESSPSTSNIRFNWTLIGYLT